MAIRSRWGVGGVEYPAVVEGDHRLDAIREGIAVLRSGYREVEWKPGHSSTPGNTAASWPAYDPRVYAALSAASELLGGDPDYVSRGAAVLELPVPALDRDQVRTLLTVMLRGERFSDGFIAGFIADGRLLEAFERTLAVLSAE